MKYHCGHNGCDICGARECAGMPLEKIGHTLGGFKVCKPCLVTSVKVAVNMSETFGGTIIDLSKPCAGKNGEGGKG